MAGSRRPIPLSIQLDVFVRDRWLCHVCRRPLIFPLAMRQLEELVQADGGVAPLAFFNLNWRRDQAPLLDELGASIDHVTSLKTGGSNEPDNLAAICARCNGRKSAMSLDEFKAKLPPWRVKGKHGEPTAWDGLSSVFVVLASRASRPLTATEKAWLKALRAWGR